MKNSILLALFGAVIAAVPASASSASFTFTGCSGSGNTQCSSDLSSYGPVASSATLNGVTVNATSTAYNIVGTSTGPTSGNTLTTALVGSYSGAGLGICESTADPNCQSPNHQINNGSDTSLTSNGSSDNFEFMLIQFSAAVDLTSIQLGNFGVTNSSQTASPFNVTYYVSNAAVGSITSLNGVALGADGFTVDTTTCTSGSCGVNGVGTDTLGNNDVTYLLIGASTANNAAGTDFFKLQQLNVSNYTSGSSTPEPATFGMFGFALAGIGWYARKRKLS